MTKPLMVALSVLALLCGGNAWGQREHDREPYPEDLSWKGRRGISANDFQVLKGLAHTGDPYAIAVQKARECVRDRRFREAFAAFQEAAALRPESAPFDEWGDALEAAGDINGAVAAYRQIVYHTGKKRDNQGRVKDTPPRDWVDARGRSVRNQVLAAGGSGWVARESNSAALLMRYCLLLLRAGQRDEAMQAYQWGYEASRYLEPRFEELRPLFDLKPTVQPVERRLLEAAAHVVIGLTERKARTREETVMPPDAAIAHFKQAVAIQPDFDAAYFFMGRSYQLKATGYDIRYRQQAIEALQAAAGSRTETVRVRARTLLDRVLAEQQH